jgi:hypothetical protein
MSANRKALPQKKPKTSRSSSRSRRYASREHQAAELLEHIRRRNRRVFKALLVLLAGDARFLAALGVLLDFMVTEATSRAPNNWEAR